MCFRKSQRGQGMSFERLLHRRTIGVAVHNEPREATGSKEPVVYTQGVLNVISMHHDRAWLNCKRRGPIGLSGPIADAPDIQSLLTFHYGSKTYAVLHRS
jgi:hypothetical protein